MFSREAAAGCAFAVALLAMGLVAPGGATGEFDDAAHCGAGGCTVSGTVSGLPAGGTIRLSNSNGDTVTVQANGAFDFPTKLTVGSSYEVTASANLNYLSCVVDHGTGVSDAIVTSVAVRCLPWQVSTFAGSGNHGYQDLRGASAEFAFPEGIAVDGHGNVYVGDTANHVVRRMTPAGMVSTLAGVAGAAGAQDGVCAQASFASPAGLAVDTTGRVFVADFSNDAVRLVLPSADLPDGAKGCVVQTLAGDSLATGGFFVRNGRNARFAGPIGVALDSASNAYVADGRNHRIQKVAPDGTVSTLAGNGARGNADGTGGASGAAQFSSPTGVAVDFAGNVYVADQGNNAIRVITPAGMVSTLAGSKQAGYNDGPVADALFNKPLSVAVDAKGVVYVADGFNNAIRMITPAGMVSTIAGKGSPSDGGHVDGISSQALFSMPVSIAVDGMGNLYVAEHGAGSYIRKLSPPTAQGASPDIEASRPFQVP